MTIYLLPADDARKPGDLNDPSQDAGEPAEHDLNPPCVLVFNASDPSGAGGLGVLELVFVTGLPDMNPADVIAALLVFRLFYLIIPLIMALFVILFFERSQLAQARKGLG